MTDARFKHVYTGPSTLWGLRQMMPVRVRAHSRGTSRLTRVALRPIETESGDEWSVPRSQVVERSLIAGLFGDDPS
jgi:hypothetical protein